MRERSPNLRSNVGPALSGRRHLNVSEELTAGVRQGRASLTQRCSAELYWLRPDGGADSRRLTRQELELCFMFRQLVYTDVPERGRRGDFPRSVARLAFSQPTCARNTWSRDSMSAGSRSARYAKRIGRRARRLIRTFRQSPADSRATSRRWFPCSNLEKTTEGPMARKPSRTQQRSDEIAELISEAGEKLVGLTINWFEHSAAHRRGRPKSTRLPRCCRG